MLGAQEPLPAPDIETLGRKPRSDRGQPRGPRTGTKKFKRIGVVNADEQAKLHGYTVLIIGTVSLLLAEQLRPTSDEIDLIFSPLERILLRRTDGVADKLNPDIIDGLQCLVGIVMYSVRVTQYAKQYAKPKPTPINRNPIGTQGPTIQGNVNQQNSGTNGYSRPEPSIENLLPNLSHGIQSNPSAGISIVASQDASNDAGN